MYYESVLGVMELLRFVDARIQKFAYGCTIVCVIWWEMSIFDRTWLDKILFSKFAKFPCVFRLFIDSFLLRSWFMNILIDLLDFSDVFKSWISLVALCLFLWCCVLCWSYTSSYIPSATRYHFWMRLIIPFSISLYSFWMECDLLAPTCEILPQKCWACCLSKVLFLLMPVHLGHVFLWLKYFLDVSLSLTSCIVVINYRYALEVVYILFVWLYDYPCFLLITHVVESFPQVVKEENSRRNHPVDFRYILFCVGVFASKWSLDLTFQAMRSAPDLVNILASCLTSSVASTRICGARLLSSILSRGSSFISLCCSFFLHLWVSAFFVTSRNSKSMLLFLSSLILRFRYDISICLPIRGNYRDRV